MSTNCECNNLYNEFFCKTPIVINKYVIVIKTLWLDWVHIYIYQGFIQILYVHIGNIYKFLNYSFPMLNIIYTSSFNFDLKPKIENIPISTKLIRELVTLMGVVDYYFSYPLIIHTFIIVKNCLPSHIYHTHHDYHQKIFIISSHVLK